ncbi:DNA cytosine methyltransferase [bacterium]|nr:DNA cytosine methyltransferase [bacterium]
MKYATIIPLIGGMTLGNKKATGKNPEYFISYDAFKRNDSHAQLNFPDVPFYIVDETTNKLSDSDFNKIETNIDFVSTVCPCSGLSSLNSGNRGADAPQNEWMYKTANFVLENISPTVFFGENAPALATPTGKKVRDTLYEIGQKYGYSFLIVKTNTILHGVPQKRQRTFYFFFKNSNVPQFNTYNRNHKSLVDYLSEVPEDSLYNDVFVNNDFDENGFMTFIKSKPEYLKENNIRSVVSFIIKNVNVAEEAIEFFKQNGYEKEIKFLNHAFNKVNDGKKFWNNSPQLLYTQNATCAIQGRVFSHSVHPNNKRYLTLREQMHLMGMPMDYKLTDVKYASHITQNVPVCTAADWTLEVMSYIKGELKLTDKQYDIFDNKLITNFKLF